MDAPAEKPDGVFCELLPGDAAGGGVLPADFGGWLLAALLSVGVLWGVSEMFFGMTWGGPMKHAFAGALHLAWHRRAERFGGGRSTRFETVGPER